MLVGSGIKISTADSNMLFNITQEVAEWTPEICEPRFYTPSQKYATIISDRPSAPVTHQEKQRDSRSSCSRTACTPAGVCTPKSCHRRRDQWADLQVRAKCLYVHSFWFMSFYYFDVFIYKCVLRYQSTSLWYFFINWLALHITKVFSWKYTSKPTNCPTGKHHLSPVAIMW